MLKLNQIVKVFGGTVALRDVHLEVQTGEFHALLGENGAGKSTLVKIIGGVHKPDQGEMIWDGFPILHHSPLKARELGIGIVHQDSAILPGLSVLENFGLGREPVTSIGWVNWDIVRVSLQEQAKRFNFQINPESSIDDLSVGERKILDIMRVLQDARNMIILDEPTAALTIEETKQLMSVLWEIKKSGISIVYVTHRLQEIKEIVDRVSVLKDGACVGTLPADEATSEKIIMMMVGREIGDMYPSLPENLPIEPLLKLKGFSREGVFDKVDIEVNSGEIVALVGLAGHGSFEMAHSIFGDPPVDEGELFLNGKLLHITNPREALNAGIGLVTEDRAENVFKVLSVRDNLSIATLRKWSKLGWINTVIEKLQIKKLITSLNIKTGGINATADSLSGGNQQKLVLGRWLATNTRILILLDPTAGVDVGARADIYKILRGLANEGHSILIATSDMSEALGLADRIYAFYQGNIAAKFPRNERSEAKVLSAITGHLVGGKDSNQKQLNPNPSKTPHLQYEKTPKVENTISVENRKKSNKKNFVSQFLSRKTAPIILMALIFIFAFLFVPNFNSSGNIKNVLVQSVPLLLTSAGQTLVIITAGIDLSIGEIVTLSTIIASSLMGIDSIGIPLAVFVCLLVGAFVGVVNAFMVGRLNLPPFLATLATMFCLQGLNLFLRPVPGGFIPLSFRKIATAKIGFLPLTPIIIIILLSALAFHFSKSRFGLQTYAVGSDEKRARLSNVSVWRVKLNVYILSGILASAAGLFLSARTGSGDPNIGSTYMFDSITATVLGGASLIGGLGTIWGAVSSGLVLAMLANILNLLGVITYWQWILRGLILVSAVAGYALMDIKNETVKSRRKTFIKKLSFLVKKNKT